MARRTFISYKYSEARNLRDQIINALGDDASYYQGETAESPDLTDASTGKIKSELTEMMYNTSVTIVVISPRMIESKWIDWKIEYCLKEISRKGRASKTNGVLGVIQKVDGGYGWLVSRKRNQDGCESRHINNAFLYKIISNNRYNLVEKDYSCQRCKTVDQLNGSYIALIDECDFLCDPSKYIENAFDKSEHIDDFVINKQR